jgi:hypothetical protein
MLVSEFINEAKSAHDVILQQTRGLSAKWEKSGLLEGLNGYDKQGMAVMLENQANQLINESSVTNPAGQGSPGENWAGVALPLVRKVFGSIASKNFVSVQPMNLPAGLVFYMDFKYGTAANGKALNGSVYGLTSGSQALTGGLYGAGAFGYSINNQFLEGLTVVSASDATFADVNFKSEWSASVAAGTLKVYTVPVSSFTQPDLLSVRVFEPSGSGVNFATATLKEFTKVVGSNVVFVVNSAAAGTIAKVEYVTQPSDTNRGDFEDRTGANLNIPEIDMELRSETIVAKTRKMKAAWSPELAQDLNAYHSVDAEAELTALLSEYISVEIDLEILDMLITSADTTEYWSARIANTWNGTGFSADSNLTGQAWTNMTWFQTLGQKMQKVSNIIHQKTMRGGANFGVVSPTVATILETIPGFTADTNGDKMEFNSGITKIGSFQNRFTIYKNPYMTENVMLLGFRGSQFLETGAVYAPYIPLIMTPLVLDPVNFTPRRGVMTRYAKKVVRPEFFGKILIADLNVV